MFGRKKRKEMSDYDKKSRDQSIGCLVFIVILFVMVTAFNNYTNSKKPVYTGERTGQANYIVVEPYFLRPCPNYSDVERCPGDPPLAWDDELEVIGYQRGEELKGSDLWVIVWYGEKEMFYPADYVEPMSPELAIELPD